MRIGTEELVLKFDFILKFDGNGLTPKPLGLICHVAIVFNAAPAEHWPTVRCDSELGGIAVPLKIPTAYSHATR